MTPTHCIECSATTETRDTESERIHRWEDDGGQVVNELHMNLLASPLTLIKRGEPVPESGS